MIYTHVLNRPGVHIRSPLDHPPTVKGLLGFMLDEKKFAFYYELSPNSR